MELTKEKFSELVKKEIIRELKEIWGPDTVESFIKETASEFNTDVDVWYDKIAELFAAANAPMLKLAQFVAKAPPTENSIKGIHVMVTRSNNTMRILGNDVCKAVQSQAEKVLRGYYSSEFKKQYGPTSQASEFLSLLRQAMHYNMK